MDYAVAEPRRTSPCRSDRPIQARRDRRPGCTPCRASRRSSSACSSTSSPRSPSGSAPADHRQVGDQRTGASLRRVPSRSRARLLVVSKVANFSIDLPDAAVAVQVSGHVRQPPGRGPTARSHPPPEGRGRQAHFYTVVSRDTNEQEFAAKRQRFLAEQGYATTSSTPRTCWPTATVDAPPGSSRAPAASTSHAFRGRYHDRSVLIVTTDSTRPVAVSRRPGG